MKVSASFLNDHAEARDALETLNRLIVDLIERDDLDGGELRFDVGPSGRVFAMQFDQPPFRPSEHAGVWIWPNWLHTTEYSFFEHATEAEVLSARWVQLNHKGGSSVIDLQNGYQQIPYPKAAMDIVIGLDNRWFGVSEDAPKIIISGILSDDGNESIESYEIGTKVVSVHLLRGASVLVAVLTNRKTLILQLPNLEIATSLDLSVYGGLTTKSGFVAHTSKGLQFVTVSMNGREIEYTTPAWIDGERPWAPSPSGQFILTWEDRIFPGALNLNVRRVRGRGGDIPDAPNGSIVGWLTLSQDD